MRTLSGGGKWGLRAVGGAGNFKYIYFVSGFIICARKRISFVDAIYRALVVMKWRNGREQ